MEDQEPQQTCPFCNDVWGMCSHYDLMVELEAEADEQGHFIEEGIEE